MTAFSMQLREANQAAWDAMIGHRFVTDIKADRLPEAVFRRYLAFEHRFVETAIVIFGYALVKAPGIAEQRPILRILHALGHDQLDYFSRTFATLGMAESEWRDVRLPPAAAGLRDGMIGFAAHGGYEDVLVGMLAAEWMYWSWCTEAAASPSRQPQLRDWVDLHAAPDFAAQAQWLMAEVDRLCPQLPPYRHQRCFEIFGRALELEIAFHDAPYGAP